jgi:hypothetical protein
MTKVETLGCNQDHDRENASIAWLDFSPKVAAANVIFTVDTLLLSILIKGRETSWFGNKNTVLTNSAANASGVPVCSLRSFNLPAAKS